MSHPRGPQGTPKKAIPKKAKPSGGRTKNRVVVHLTSGGALRFQCIDTIEHIKKALAKAHETGSIATLRTGWNATMNISGQHITAYEIGDRPQ